MIYIYCNDKKQSYLLTLGSIWLLGLTFQTSSNSKQHIPCQEPARRAKKKHICKQNQWFYLVDFVHIYQILLREEKNTNLILEICIISDIAELLGLWCTYLFIFSETFKQFSIIRFCISKRKEKQNKTIRKKKYFLRCYHHTCHTKQLKLLSTDHIAR